MDTQGQLLELMEWAAKQAALAGADQSEFAVRQSNGFSLTMRKAVLDSLQQHQSRSFAVNLFFNHKKGSASTSDFSKAAIEETIAYAASIARYTAADPCSGLADADDLATEFRALDLLHPWAIAPTEAIGLVNRMEEAGFALDTRITNCRSASFSTNRAASVYANSLGFRGVRETTSHSMACTLIATQDDKMESEHWYSARCDAADLESPEDIGQHAAKNAVARLGGRSLASQAVPVLFSPAAARSLIGHFLAAISGSQLYREASFLLGKLEQKIASSQLQIRQDPFIPKAFGSANFDADGVATRPRLLLEDGLLQGYLLGVYSARRMGLRTTGNAGGAQNILVQATHPTQQALLHTMGRGLYVSDLMGQGVNLLTGDYSRGATGFWVENGEMQFPVHEITLAGNLKDMFKKIVGVGADVEEGSSVRTGSILIEEMMVAGSGKV